MKRLTKVILLLILLSVFVSVLKISACATDYDSYMTEYVENEVFDSTPDNVKSLFEKLGITSIDFDSLFDVTGTEILNVIKTIVTGAIESPTKSMVRVVTVIIILAVFECFFPDDTKIISLMELAGILFCIISIIKPISFAITSGVSSVTVAEKFMLILIPVLTAVVSASGNPALAVSFQSIAFAAAQIISAIASKILVPAVGIVLAMDISGSIMPRYKLSGLTEMIKKCITTILSFSATLFVTFLGLKAGLANSADSVVNKGIKLAISSAVPVVGGALSEAYSGVVGNISLVKSTVGVFGIGAIALITLPSCIQLLFWIFALRISSGIAALFEQKGIAALLKSIASSLVLLNVVIVFVAVLFVISTSLILVLKAG